LATFKFIDLFAGIGGFHIGMRLNGGECVFANEWDKYSAQTYRAWTESNHLNTEDLRELDYQKVIPSHDILCGGFPCQPFSIAGVSKKNSLGRKHGFQDVEQGNLFFAICDVVSAKRPAVLFLENVKNLKSHDKGKTWKVIQEAIDQLGYEMKAQIVDAGSWVPQHRERLFMVCFDRKKFTKAEIDSFEFPLAPKKPQYLQKYAAKHKAAGNGFGYGLVGPDDTTRTLSARYYKDGSEILIKQPYWRNPRRLTPSEAARLMGFNSRLAKFMGFSGEFPQVCSDMQSYKQFGNAVSPLVVEAIGKQIVDVLELRKLRLEIKSGKSSSHRKVSLKSN
jgi:DNA (cytosine-5)-methyltransferase 1